MRKSRFKVPALAGPNVALCDRRRLMMRKVFASSAMIGVVFLFGTPANMQTSVSESAA